MNRILRLLACLLLFLPALAAGQAEEEPIRVGITEVPPFVMKSDNGEWEGISIDLWRQVADKLDRKYEWVPLSFNDLLKQVESGQIDVAVGALTMTAARESVFDFTHPFYQTGLSIAIPPAPEQGLMASLLGLLSWDFFKVVMSLGALLLGVGFVLWLVERKRNPEQFGGSAAEGIGSSFWWAAVTMTTVGYGDKAPVSLAGRFVALVWMFAGLIMVASFTAAITSSLTVNNLRSQIQGPEDLIQAKVATIANTASEEYLQDQRIRHEEYPNLTEAMMSVVRGETDAVVYDRALLQYRNLQLGSDRLTLLPAVFQKQLYALALPADSNLRAPVSEAILTVTEADNWQGNVRKYLGQD
ncbi:transporter substrate-binding domain-containing protein [Marinobacter sp. CHS3-4]|uniref:transporter substrate-binding domain-containing protein n=1 Tax=Marinobacter sp. CHS3-4 TaxID=3045174 RepID=UPI0024B5DE6D|nr:transporter substrate-binding domain-containing protein [Marinobacter sp. CHS3-4]MDI9243863.1 transporter substrate-binding domain-containing protein [Marinobacter sp. CHS3-4]